MYDYRVYRLTTDEPIFLIIKKIKNVQKDQTDDQYYVLNKNYIKKLNVLKEISRDPNIERIVTFDKPFFDKSGTKIAILSTLEYDKDLFKNIIVAECVVGPFREYVVEYLLNQFPNPNDQLSVPPNTPNNSRQTSPKNMIQQFFNHFSKKY